MVTNEHVKDLLPAYALDCLDEEETLLVSQHLAACPECRQELRAYQSVADQLPLATPLVEPPADLKAKLMAQVEAGQTFAAQAQQPAQARRGIAAFLSRLAPVWSLASLALVLVLAVSNLLLWRQVNPPGGSPSMRLIRLDHTEAAPSAHGLVVMSTDGEYGTLVVDHLPALPAVQQYQLWLIKDGKRTSGGVFSVSEDGYASLWVASPQPLKVYSGFGITVEPAGGSPGPTGPKVLGGNL